MTFETEGTAPTAPHHTAAGTLPRADLHETVLASLSDSKAEDIVSIDITGKSPMTDQVVVASGRSHRHVGAIADHLLRDLKEAGHGSARVEGIPQCDWVLIDAGDVIIHVFRPEVRAFYNIEKMWSVDDNAPVHYAG
ncbi:ribosome silencing factor [Stappia stellulata]|uniref:ribosome silencing factor n=1 Tax=Stappia stellulata TaxID=71235 RepID=UPI00041A08B1|nr:ribosome silencing factor [Stappia stellulata]